MNAENQYIIGVTNNAKYTKGKIFNDEGTDLNRFDNAIRYEFSNNYTDDMYTFCFENHPLIIFGEIKGEYQYYKIREYNSYIYNIKKNINNHYIGLYTTKQNLTCAFIDRNENNLVNIYDMTYQNDLKSLINETKIESNFICLNEKYDIIKFNSSNDINITFIIYDPQIKKEEFTKSNSKFYIPQKKEIFFEEEQFDYDNFRVVIKIYPKNEVDLEYGKIEKREKFQFLNNNSFSYVIQYNINDSESYTFNFI